MSSAESNIVSPIVKETRWLPWLEYFLFTLA
jgi:hypothetical protein